MSFASLLVGFHGLTEFQITQRYAENYFASSALRVHLCVLCDENE